MPTSFPETIQHFKYFINTDENDANLIAQYQGAVERGDFNYANQILKKINSFKNKTITALDLNQIFETCEALQDYYLNAYSPAYVVSETQPIGQQTGDYWFQIIGSHGA